MRPKRDLKVLHALAVPDLWARLRDQSLTRDLEGRTDVVLAAIAAEAKLPLDPVPGAEAGVRVSIRSRGGRLSLLEALEEACGRNRFLLRDGRIRIVSVDEAWTAWQEWWAARGKK